MELNTHNNCKLSLLIIPIILLVLLIGSGLSDGKPTSDPLNLFAQQSPPQTTILPTRRFPRAAPVKVFDTSDTTSEENDQSDTTSEEKAPPPLKAADTGDKSDHSDTTSEENDLTPETTSEEKDMTPETTSEESDDKTVETKTTTTKGGDSSSSSSESNSESLPGQSDEECDSGSKSDSKSDEKDPKAKSDSDSSSSSSESNSDEDQSTKKKLLVILVDGMRHDYIVRDRKLRGFPRAAARGVTAVVKPVFPSNSYPNWYTIVTGQYPEGHGIVGNYMYDAVKEDHFLMGPHPNASHCHWWSGAEPIWITAQREAGIKSALYWWDGCQVKIRGRRADKCVRYRDYLDDDGGLWESQKEEFDAALEEGLDGIQKDEFSLVMMYHGAVDHYGHAYGPDSRRAKYAVRDVDRMIDKLQDEIVERELGGRLNVLIVSDHGMVTVQNYEQINLDEVLDLNDVEKVTGGGAVAMILPEEGKEAQVYEQIRQSNIAGLNVYNKERIPERLQYTDHRRILPVIVTADEGYTIVTPEIKGRVYPGGGSGGTPSKGGHGYDPDYVDEMLTLMFGFGPDFRQGLNLDDDDSQSESSDSSNDNDSSGPVGDVELEQVDHYNLMAHLLGIEPQKNDGSWRRAYPLLKASESDELPDDSAEIYHSASVDSAASDPAVGPGQGWWIIFQLAHLLSTTIVIPMLIL